MREQETVDDPDPRTAVKPEPGASDESRELPETHPRDEGQAPNEGVSEPPREAPPGSRK